jgi:hypothetical protein
MSGKDLGTYYVRVEFTDGRGCLMDWSTGARYVGGGYGPMPPIYGGVQPLTATRMPPAYKDEDDLFAAMVYMFTDGNYGCDCNRALFLARAAQAHDAEDEHPCGHTLRLARLTAIRPDGSEVVLIDTPESSLDAIAGEEGERP